MLNGEFDIEAWLSERSVAIQRHNSFIEYTHFTGERSFVSLRNKPLEEPTIKNHPFLGSFFDRYNGFSIGNDHIILGSVDALGDEERVRGFVLPSLSQMKQIANGLETCPPESEMIFMAEAAWMFVYSIERETTEVVIYKYDREYRKKRVIPSLESILNSWWEIVLEDPLE